MTDLDEASGMAAMKQLLHGTVVAISTVLSVCSCGSSAGKLAAGRPGAVKALPEQTAQASAVTMPERRVSPSARPAPLQAGKAALMQSTNPRSR